MKVEANISSGFCLACKYIMADKDTVVEKNESQSPEPATEANNTTTESKQSTVTSEEWIAMHNVLSNVYAYRVEGYVVLPMLSFSSHVS